MQFSCQLIQQSTKTLQIAEHQGLKIHILQCIANYKQILFYEKLFSE